MTGEAMWIYGRTFLKGCWYASASRPNYRRKLVASRPYRGQTRIVYRSRYGNEGACSEEEWVKWAGEKVEP